ncbi:nucleotidyltransferase domain-containing protein [Paenibacillus pectinilyticus]
MMKLLEPLLPSISTIHSRLQQAHEVRWLIGGSCGLLLHNVDIGRNPRDLDIYIDQKDVHAVHALLQPYAIDSPTYSETPIYASILSHYHIDGHTVEIVGDFKVSAHASLYQIEIEYLWDHHPNTAIVEDRMVHLMPLAHEFLFNVLRNRPDRYEPILRTMQGQPDVHMPALEDLLIRNQWGLDFQEKLKELLDWQR